MAVLALLFVRLPVASYLVLFGLGKIVNRPQVGRMWHPSFLTQSRWRSVLLVVSGLEVVAGIALLAAPGPLVGGAVSALLLFATLYGVYAIAHTGSCGCGGSNRPERVARLVARNAALALAALIGGLTSAPSAADIHAASPWLEMTPMVPIVGLYVSGGVVAWRVRRRQGRLAVRRAMIASS